MGILIGKKTDTGFTAASGEPCYKQTQRRIYCVKLDTENYRERRKETLEQLAKNIAYKVKENKTSGIT